MSQNEGCNKDRMGLGHWDQCSVVPRVLSCLLQNLQYLSGKFFLEQENLGGTG